MGGAPKQFRELGGKPLLVQTLRVFERHPDVGAVVVAAPVGEVDGLREMLRGEGLAKPTDVVAGGATRQTSVALALAAVPAQTDVVLVHDAVRPFAEAAHVRAVIEAARTSGAAALAVPVADTLRRGTGAGAFGETVPRQGLYRMQTPQGFRRGWLQAAHEAARRDGLVATDDVELVQRLGHAVQIVLGSTRNFKITTPADWELAQALWGALRVETLEG